MELSTPTKLGVYAAGLAVVFAAALGLGAAVGPSVATDPPPAGEMGEMDMTGGAHSEEDR